MYMFLERISLDELFAKLDGHAPTHRASNVESHGGEC